MLFLLSLLLLLLLLLSCCCCHCFCCHCCCCHCCCLLQMIIRMGRPFANDHPDWLAFCKWSSKWLNPALPPSPWLCLGASDHLLNEKKENMFTDFFIKYFTYRKVCYIIIFILLRRATVPFHPKSTYFLNLKSVSLQPKECIFSTTRVYFHKYHHRPYLVFGVIHLLGWANLI